MLELTRTVRFCLNGDGTLAAEAAARNTFAWWPPMRGLGRYYELEVTCRGEADPVTGYFMNIKRIDEVVRKFVLPRFSEVARDPENSLRLGGVMRCTIKALQPVLDCSVTAVVLRLAPSYSLTIQENAMQQVLITQQYEFSASHRLHVEHIGDQKNREIFGKCNNPAGHGHNYRLEVTVRSPIDSGGAITPVEELDELVDRVVVQKLDHKNLSVDVPEFAELNTSVENIARVIYEMLKSAVKSLHVELDQVRVWETGKTVCTYRG